MSSSTRPTDPARPAAVLASLLAPGDPEDLYSPAGARLYERLAAFDTSEQAALLRLLSEDDGEILELACGGGRLALPLLSLGRPVTGIDLSPEMIRLLLRRYDGLPTSRRPAPLTAIVGDMRDFSLGRTFGSIVLGTTSLLLLDGKDRARLYGVVRRHLGPQGRFLVSVHASAPRPGATSTRIVPLVDGEAEAAVISDEVTRDGRTRHVSILHVARERGGALEAAEYASTVAVLTADEVDHELVDAGFSRVESVDAGAGAAGSEGLLIRAYTA